MKELSKIPNLLKKHNLNPKAQFSQKKTSLILRKNIFVHKMTLSDVTVGRMMVLGSMIFLIYYFIWVILMPIMKVPNGKI